MDFARIIRRQASRVGGSDDARGGNDEPRVTSLDRRAATPPLRSRVLRTVVGAMASRGANPGSRTPPDAQSSAGHANAGNRVDALADVDPNADPRGPVPAFTEFAGRGETTRIRASETPAWDRTDDGSRTLIIPPARSTPRVIGPPAFGQDRRTPEQRADWALLDGARRLSYAAIDGALRAQACLEVRSVLGCQTALHKVFKQPRPVTEQEWTNVVAIVRLLLDEGARLNDGDAKGVTPLYQASRMGYLDRPEVRSLVRREYSEEEIDQHCEHVGSLLAESWSPAAP